MLNLGLFFDLTQLSGDLRVAALDGMPLRAARTKLEEQTLISLFTWREAALSDGLAAPNRKGWWGDAFAAVPGDRIGSRLYLLSRRKLTQETLALARDLTFEALDWMRQPRPDGGPSLVTDIQVEVRRSGLERIEIVPRLTERDGAITAFIASLPVS